MSEHHPITPPPELVDQWDEEGTNMFRPSYQIHLTTQAARWGADQELEACCEYLTRCAAWEPDDVAELLDHRRFRPPSLKEQALGALGRFNANAHTRADEMVQDFDTIRRALQQLDG
jgi:hypothetical protein